MKVILGSIALTFLCAFILLPVIKCIFVQKKNEDCTPIEHQDCDDRCKLANFWYGVCSYWDGYSELGCKCLPYENGLRADEVCDQREHDRCHSECQKNDTSSTTVGGYCFPKSVEEKPWGVAACGCFRQ